MSKRNLERILDDISRTVKGSRDNYNTEMHKYTVRFTDILEEVYYQVNNTNLKTDIPKDLLREPVKRYCDTLYSKFKSYNSSEYTVKTFGPPDFFTVMLKPTRPNQNVFATLKRHRTPALNTLKDEVIKIVVQVLKGNKSYTTSKHNTAYDNIFGKNSTRSSGTIQRDGGLLEVGHMQGSSVIEHELFKSKLAFAETVTTLPASMAQKANVILAQLDFKMVTNSREHGVLRNGKIVVSVFDQSKSRNSAQSNEEQTLRKKFQQAISKVLSEVDLAGLEGSPNVFDIVHGKLHTSAAKLKAKGVNKNLMLKAKKVYTSEATKSVRGTLLTTTISESLAGALKADFHAFNSTKKSRNWASIVGIINQQMHQRLAINMKYPRLQYRTGRFARSVQVLGVEQTAQGYPSFVYDFDHRPYDVFSRSRGAPPWNTPERDPDALINLTIRDIVQELAIGRFYIRRA